jgi:hypothetical protein
VGPRVGVEVLGFLKGVFCSGLHKRVPKEPHECLYEVDTAKSF